MIILVTIMCIVAVPIWIGWFWDMGVELMNQLTWVVKKLIELIRWIEEDSPRFSRRSAWLPRELPPPPPRDKK